MYAFISGKIAEITPAYVIVDNHGVGYFINITLNTFTAIGEKEEVRLYTHEQILEDAHNLFGFYSAKERDLFELLISVSGVGCNTARLILSSLTVNELSNAIANDDVKTIQAVKGIGAKTAQRIVIDLKDKLKKNDFPTEIFATADNTIKTEALSALTILGFGKAAVDNADNASVLIVLSAGAKISVGKSFFFSLSFRSMTMRWAVLAPMPFTAWMVFTSSVAMALQIGRAHV